MNGPGHRLGLFGGTFNPVHLGHLRAAEEITGLLRLERLLFVPAALPPHKRTAPLVSMAHRLAMLRLAVAGRPGFGVSDIEGRRQGPSYTVETLTHFKQQGAGHPIFFITGVDAFLEIESWKDHEKLFTLAGFAVISRPGVDAGRLSDLLNRISPGYEWRSGENAFLCPGKEPVLYHDVTRLDISSTGIRARLAGGESIRYLVPEAVLEYIEMNGLYKTNPQPEEGTHS